MGAPNMSACYLFSRRIVGTAETTSPSFKISLIFSKVPLLLCLFSAFLSTFFLAVLRNSPTLISLVFSHHSFCPCYCVLDDAHRTRLVRNDRAECTGFTLRPVTGLLSARNFLYGDYWHSYYWSSHSSWLEAHAT